MNSRETQQQTSNEQRQNLENSQTFGILTKDDLRTAVLFTDDNALDTVIRQMCLRGVMKENGNDMSDSYLLLLPTVQEIEERLSDLIRTTTMMFLNKVLPTATEQEKTEAVQWLAKRFFALHQHDPLTGKVFSDTWVYPIAVDEKELIKEGLMVGLSQHFSPSNNSNPLKKLDSIAKATQKEKGRFLVTLSKHFSPSNNSNPLTSSDHDHQWQLFTLIQDALHARGIIGHSEPSSQNKLVFLLNYDEAMKRMCFLPHKKEILRIVEQHYSDNCRDQLPLPPHKRVKIIDGNISQEIAMNAHKLTKTMTTTITRVEDSNSLFNAFAFALCGWIAEQYRIILSKKEQFTLEALGLENLLDFTQLVSLSITFHDSTALHPLPPEQIINDLISLWQQKQYSIIQGQLVSALRVVARGHIKNAYNENEQIKHLLMKNMERDLRAFNDDQLTQCLNNPILRDTYINRYLEEYATGYFEKTRSNSIRGGEIELLALACYFGIWIDIKGQSLKKINPHFGILTEEVLRASFEDEEKRDKIIKQMCTRRIIKSIHSDGNYLLQLPMEQIKKRLDNVVDPKEIDKYSMSFYEEYPCLIGQLVPYKLLKDAGNELRARGIITDSSLTQLDNRTPVFLLNHDEAIRRMQALKDKETIIKSIETQNDKVPQPIISLYCDATDNYDVVESTSKQQQAVDRQQQTIIADAVIKDTKPPEEAGLYRTLTSDHQKRARMNFPSPIRTMSRRKSFLYPSSSTRISTCNTFKATAGNSSLFNAFSIVLCAWMAMKTEQELQNVEAFAKLVYGRVHNNALYLKFIKKQVTNRDSLSTPIHYLIWLWVKKPRKYLITIQSTLAPILRQLACDQLSNDQQIKNILVDKWQSENQVSPINKEDDIKQYITKMRTESRSQRDRKCFPGTEIELAALANYFGVQVQLKDIITININFGTLSKEVLRGCFHNMDEVDKGIRRMCYQAIIKESDYDCDNYVLQLPLEETIIKLQTIPCRVDILGYRILDNVVKQVYKEQPIFSLECINNNQYHALFFPKDQTQLQQYTIPIKSKAMPRKKSFLDLSTKCKRSINRSQMIEGLCPISSDTPRTAKRRH